MDNRKSRTLEVRRALALPLYVLPLILNFSADLLGILAATIATVDEHIGSAHRGVGA